MISKPQAAKVVKKIISPIEKFMEMETGSGILLLLITVFAMWWANSAYHEDYAHFVEFPLGLQLGGYSLVKTLHHWVNDGLMAIFFFVVGLEIKRELVIGELSTPKKAVLPMLAAAGGMVVPALIYVAFNMGQPSVHGWGIPMATDIAFAIGILSLVGPRVPFSLKIFLLALAIVDDLGAVLVIAFFYTEQISLNALAFSATILFMVYILKYAGVKSLLIYVILGIAAWLGILKSGVHATIAGVILGLMAPATAFLRPKEVAEKIKKYSAELQSSLTDERSTGRLSEDSEESLHHLEQVSIDAKSPLDRLIHTLHPWVSYFIMPVFALVNAGIHITDLSFSEFIQHEISLGVILGLFVGKPLGILLFCFVAIKLGWAQLPHRVTWLSLTGVSFLAGIGFTMALFISHLALKIPEVEIYSKLGILVASLAAGIVGLTLLSLHKPSEQNQ